MPAYSSLRTFFESLKSGETNITKTLKRALDGQGTGLIRNKVSVDPILSPAIRIQLENYGMSLEEIEHVANDWPADKRDQVRKWVLAAIAAGRPVEFYWELHEGLDPENRRDLKGTGPVKITFLSPRAGVHLSPSHFGQVHVDR
jgi:hypothetical protein